jgi:hypothetical protein
MKRTRTQPAPDDKQRTTISISGEVWTSGALRAADEGRNFSNYVEWLIKKDVKAGAKGGKRA